MNKHTVKAIQDRLDFFKMTYGTDMTGHDISWHIGKNRYDFHFHNHALKPYVLKYSDDGIIQGNNAGIITEDWRFIPDVLPERR